MESLAINHYFNERNGMCKLVTPGFLIGSNRALKFRTKIFCPMSNAYPNSPQGSQAHAMQNGLLKKALL
jgi:hypothetical protein